MKGFLGVTDNDWFACLSQQQVNESQTSAFILLPQNLTAVQHAMSAILVTAFLCVSN